MKTKWWAWFRNVLGAFSDGAILLPLLVLLSMHCGFSMVMLLASAGVLYWVSGSLFRIPMPVQPLKSLVVSAVAVGASSSEVQVAGGCIGVLCLLLSIGPMHRWLEKMPLTCVHGLQLSLGIMLVMQGMKVVSPLSAWEQGMAFGLMGVGGVVTTLFQLPVLGWAALVGMMGAMGVTPDHAMPFSPMSLAHTRWSVVMLLVVPQLVLTLGNSVVATSVVARRYFGDRAFRVTHQRLLWSSGLGNLVTMGIGGLPFCHGSGGLTAHVRGGSTHWGSNTIIGTLLVMCAGVCALGYSVTFHYSPLVLSSLLVVIGLFHMTLARPSLDKPFGKIKLGGVGAAAWISQNLLCALGVGLFLEVVLGGVKWQKSDA